MREQPVEPAPDPYGEFTCPRCGSGLWGTSHCTGDKSEWIGHCHGDGCRFTWHRATQDESVGLTKVPEIAPIEVLVPRPLQDLSGSIQFQDGWDEAQAVAGAVQGPAIEDRADLIALLRRCRPFVDADAQMMADITRHSPLDHESQARHDSTEYESEALLPLIDAALSGVEPRPQDRQEG